MLTNIVHHPFRFLFQSVIVLLLASCTGRVTNSPTADANNGSVQPTVQQEPSEEPAKNQIQLESVIAPVTSEIPAKEPGMAISLADWKNKTLIGMQAFAFGINYNGDQFLASINGNDITMEDVEGKRFTVPIERIRVNFVNEDANNTLDSVMAIFDEKENPIYVRVNGAWEAVEPDTEEGSYAWTTSELGRRVRWDGGWELTIPLTDAQVSKLGGGYKMDDGKLMYNLSVAMEEGEGKKLQIRTAEGGVMEFAPEDLIVHNVAAADYNGNPIDAMLTMKAPAGWRVPGWGEMGEFILIKGEWSLRLDVAKTREITTWDEIPEITWDDFVSGRLFYNELLAIRDNPPGALMPILRAMRLQTITNVWNLTQYNAYGWDYEVGLGNLTNNGDPRKLSKSIDTVQKLGAVRVKDPNSGKWMTIKTQQYPYGDRMVLIHIFFGDDYSDPSKPAFYRLQMSLDEGSDTLTEPIISLMPEKDGYWCGIGGLGEMLAPQPSICNVQGTNGVPEVRGLLPEKLQSLMSGYDQPEPLEAGISEVYVVGDWIFGLQGAVTGQFSNARHTPGYMFDYQDFSKK